MSTSLDISKGIHDPAITDGCSTDTTPTPNANEVPPHLTTAQDLLAWIQADQSLSKQVRRNQASAIRALGKATHQPLALIPLDPTYLNAKIFALTPEQAGYKKKRWARIRSDCGKALARTGILVVAVRRRNAPSFAWQVLLRRLPERHLHYRLSPIARFCSAQGSEPADVGQAVFDRFHHEETTQTAKGSQAYVSYRNTCRAWNEAAARFPWWPQVTVIIPDYSNRFHIDKGLFPESFWKDFNAYAAASSTPKAKGKPFSLQNQKTARPLRQATLDHRYYLCWEMASAQVHRGRKIEEIDGLAALIAGEWVAEGLNFLLERYGGERTKRLHEFATTMKSIAVNWVHLGGACPEALVGLCADALPDEAPAFSDKNKAALMQFNSPERVRALLTLPYVIAHSIGAKKKISAEDARLMLGAMAIEILLITMVRLENLANIDIEKNLLTFGTGKDATRMLIFASEDVKNGKALRFAMPPRTWRLWCFFVEKCRPLLLTSATSNLFPLAETSKKRKSRLRHLVVNLVKERTGLTLTVHQFRHFGVMLYRKRFPNDLETPRIALGHKNERTLRKYYAWLDESEACKNFTDVVLGDCEQWLAELGF